MARRRPARPRTALAAPPRSEARFPAEATRRAIQVLRAGNYRFALIGGVAFSLRHRPRFTADVDFVVLVGSDREAAQLGAHMLANGMKTHALLEDAAGNLATMRLKAGAILVDLLVGAIGFEAEVVGTATMETLEEGLTCPVATVAARMAMKVLAAPSARSPRTLRTCRT
jgi:hypothetical protein